VPTSPTQGRLAYIDWMRGLACVLMFQTHCYDSWLGPSARQSSFFMWSRLAGTMPAPLFLFLTGISLALTTDKLRQRGLGANTIARTTMRRGAEILVLGLLFRLQQFVFCWRWVPWTDLFRVDILNQIGLSLMLMAMVVRLAAWLHNTIGDMGSQAKTSWGRGLSIGLAVAAAVGISLATPPLWTTHRPRWLPWMLESYVNGVHIFSEPKSYFFPVFPWAGLAFAGLAAGLVLASAWAKRNEGSVFALGAVAGVVAIFVGLWIDRLPAHFYAVYSYWTTSPEFFLVRIGLLLLFLAASYGWCRWGAGSRGFSPLIQLGRTSLLVYWVHIELVYGRSIILPSHANGIGVASFGLVFITLFMLVLSRLRTDAYPLLLRRRVEAVRGQVVGQ
jgi:uncharacterized membrane protein